MKEIDYTKLTDEEFHEHCAALYAEQSRRSKLQSIPNDIKVMSNDFVSIEGNKEDLITRINEPEPVTEEELKEDQE